MSIPQPPKKPLIPKLVMGGLAILLLSWLAFMVHYVRRVASQPRGGEAPPRAMPAATNGAGQKR